MKIALFFLFALGIFYILWKKRGKKFNSIKFVGLESKTQSNRHLPNVSENVISEIENSYIGKEFNPYSSAYYDIINKLCNDVYSKSMYWEKNQTHADFLNELTREQRVVFTLVNFESQVHNGGVYQFLFNNPELSLIALQSMEETGMEKLSSDYRVTLNEYFGKFESIQELRDKFNDKSSTWNKQWSSFVEGYAELKSAERIEEYFYDEDFIKYFQSQICNYIKLNKNQLYISD